MTKALRLLTLGLGFVLALGTVYAQPSPPKPAPAPAPPPKAPAPDPAGAGSGSGGGATHEKAGNDESLQNGGDTRPWAAGVKPSDRDAALKLFHEGNLQLNDGLFAKAADIYVSALKRWDHPAIHYNLALAEMNLDQPIDAFDNFTAAIKYGDAPLQSKDKFDHAKDYLLLLNKEIGEVEVTCNKTGAKVSVDNKEVFTAPGTYKGRVRAGKHTFVAELEGHPTRIDAPYISPGAPFRIELKLYTVSELTRYSRKWDTTWLPYAVIGGGVLVGIVGGLFELAASNDYKSYDDKVAACNAGTAMNGGCAQSKSLSDLTHSGDEKKTAGFVMYGVAGAAVAVGTALWWINRPQAYQVRPEDLNDEQISVAPVVTPSYAGAALQGRF